MTSKLPIAVLGLTLLLQACNRTEEGASGAAGEAPPTGAAATASGSASRAEAPSGPFSTTGEVVAVSGTSVTINHEAVEALGWPAMSMSFDAQPSMVEGLEAGTPVAFSFRKSGDRYVLTELNPR